MKLYLTRFNGWFGRLMLLATLLLVTALAPVAAQGRGPLPVLVRGAYQSRSFAPTLSAPVRSLPTVALGLPGKTREVPRRYSGKAGVAPAQDNVAGDPLMGSFTVNPSTRAVSELLNFDGQSFSGVYPSDNNGDVGLNEYIQIINGGTGTPFIVYDKTDGSILAGPTFLSDLAASGSNCANNAFGDPNVLFDQIAERWLMSEFYDSGSEPGLCIYVSETSDPTGAFFAYEVPTPNFPDYFKFAVWSNAYFVTANEFTSTNEPAIYAFDRSKMLAGLPTTFQRVSVPPLAAFDFQSLLPVDADGKTPPPAGAPGLMAWQRDDEMHNAGSNDAAHDFIDVFSYAVDWKDPANTTLSGPLSIQTSEFDSDLCGTAFVGCVPQPGTSVTLDPLREVLMWRVQYRNFGDYQSIVGNFSTDVGSDRAGVRWFELRDTGSDWTLFQEGTVTAADVTHRWMGSIAQDGSGDIALGYDISNGVAVFPGAAYTGRLASDTPGTMTQGENIYIDGTGAHPNLRWGDYNGMVVDPVDDCTFWFTSQYAIDGSWATRITSFRFDECVSAPVELIQNGGFENIGTNGKADVAPWVVKNPTGDTVKCDKFNKQFAYTGQCAFRFSGNANENAKIQQIPDITGLSFVSGDTLRFSAQVNANALGVVGKLKVAIRYGDGSSTKINPAVTTTSGYTKLSGDGVLTSADVTKIKVQIIHKTASGKMYVDDVSLQWLLTAPVRASSNSSVLPLP